MRVVQRACVLRQRHHGVMTHLPLPCHLLGCASQYGVPAAQQAFRPPVPLQGVLVRSLHPSKRSPYRIRAALLARGPLPHLPGLMWTRHQQPGLGRGTDARGTEALPNRLLFPLNRVVQLATLVFPRRHFFTLWTEASRRLRIRPGETQSPPLNRHPLAQIILHLVLALPHPAPPSVPI
jgi:hypothetical protein